MNTSIFSSHMQILIIIHTQMNFPASGKTLIRAFSHARSPLSSPCLNNTQMLTSP